MHTEFLPENLEEVTCAIDTDFLQILLSQHQSWKQFKLDSEVTSVAIMTEWTKQSRAGNNSRWFALCQLLWLPAQ